jgi:membrane peptidoglycan carboxypeptidase
LSSSDEKTEADLKVDARSAGADPAVTPEQIWASLRTLMRQIAVLAMATIRSASNRAMIALKSLRSAIGSAGADVRIRWPQLRTRLALSAAKVRRREADLKSHFMAWRGSLESGRFWPRLGLGKFRLKYLVASLALAAVLLLALIVFSIATLPIAGGLQVEPTQSAVTIEGANGEAFATRGVFKGDRLTAQDLPPHLAQAIIAIEDRRFYQHWGVDIRGILRAGWRNSQAGSTREGGSTITQQLARLVFLSPERTLRRKTQEALLAIWLEGQLTKEEILLRYLNTAYFGAGAYGVDAAARRYFGKRAGELSLAESAMLAGLVRAPSQLAPTRNFGGAKERQETVLQAMVETQAISATEAETARAQKVNLRTPPETPPGTNYFVDMVAGDLRRMLGSSSGDLTLRTTLNLELQRLAEGVIERRLEQEGAKKRV